MTIHQLFDLHQAALIEFRGNGDNTDYQQLAADINVSDDEALKLMRMANASNASDAKQTVVSFGLGDFLNLELPPRECLLSPWLTRQGLAMVYAPRGLGKTYLALGIAYACATGGTFLSWKAEKPCNVVYIDGEMPAATMQERLLAMVEADDRDDIDAAIDGLQIVSQEKQEPSMPDLSSVEGQALFNRVTDPADLIIVDNISTLCRAGAENKADDWNIVSEWALRMRRYGKTVLFVHHAGKGGQQRGTSKREDILDVVIALRKPLDDSAEGASFELHFEKARHLFGNDTKPFVATLVGGLWSMELLEENTYRRVVDLANEGMSVTEIAKEIDRAKSNVSRHMKKARDSGDLTTESNGASSQKYGNRRAKE